MRGKSPNIIIRNGRSVEFKADDGRSIAVQMLDSTRRAWYVSIDGKMLKVEKSTQPTVEVGGVTYKYAPRPKAPKVSTKTIDGDKLDGELKKLLGREAAKLAEVGKKTLELMAPHGDRFKLELSNGVQLVIARPAWTFKKSRKAERAA